MNENTTEIKELDAVALLEDLPEHGFVRGQIGTALDELAPGAFDVEFSDSLGRTVALVPLPSEKLMALHRITVKAA